ncbi:hypothetical protein F4678DRAFT_426498 [Xylaria arbuscula]|nr:hypothetical protein F4678DRAFT_426498 [Xylaria arbuscula]
MNNTILPDALSKLAEWQIVYLGKLEYRVLINKITALALSNAVAGVSVIVTLGKTYYQLALSRMAASETLSHTAEVVTANLGKTGTLVVGIIGILKPMLVATPILWLLGFRSALKAGSIATRWMARIGNVVVGSLYSILQSAGAAGRGVARVTRAVRGLSVIAIVLVLLKIYQSWN